MRHHRIRKEIFKDRFDREKFCVYVRGIDRGARQAAAHVHTHVRERGENVVGLSISRPLSCLSRWFFRKSLGFFITIFSDVNNRPPVGC